MTGILSEYKKAVLGTLFAVTLTGLAFAADSRWMTRANFQEWVSAQEERQILAEIRDLEIEINALESEIAWSDDPRKIAALQERIRYLEAQISDLERQL